MATDHRPVFAGLWAAIIGARRQGRVVARREREGRDMLPEIDAIVDQRVERDGPGLAVALINAGEVLHARGYGYANLEWHQPITPETVFCIGSLTKPFTATAILLLEREGKIHLNDPITAYLPEYPMGERVVTVAHLLSHRSGIANFVTQPGFWEHTAQFDFAPQELLPLFTGLPPNFAPGERYSYSNSGYCLLGLIIESVSGVPYGTFVRQHVFAPLGMTDSRYVLHAPIIPHRASGYQRAEQGYAHAPRFSMTLPYSAGGLGSTLRDLITWDQAMRDHLLLDAGAEQRMRTPSRLNDGRTEDYGLGWAFSDFRGRRVVHHAGGVPGYSSFYGHFVEDDTTIIVLSNIAGFDASGLAREIADSVLHLPPLPRAASSVVPDAMRKMTGTYSDHISTFTVSANKDGLRLSDDFDEFDFALELVAGNIARAIGDEDVVVYFADEDEHRYRRAKVVVPFYWVSAYRVAATPGAV
jgi:CubicO group peptidase (beta-lactamase class C family)